MDNFEKKIMWGMVISFIIFVGGIITVVTTVVDHSHEIASGAGSLAHDFMKSATKTD